MISITTQRHSNTNQPRELYVLPALLRHDGTDRNTTNNHYTACRKSGVYLPIRAFNHACDLFQCCGGAVLHINCLLRLRLCLSMRLSVYVGNFIAYGGDDDDNNLSGMRCVLCVCVCVQQSTTDLSNYRVFSTQCNGRLYL